MGCNSCKYLQEMNKKEGKTSGAVYYCAKLKKYVSGASDGCDSYYKDYSRKACVRDEIFHDGEHFSDNSMSIESGIILIIILIILGMIMKVFN